MFPLNKDEQSAIVLLKVYVHIICSHKGNMVKIFEINFPVGVGL